MKKVIIIIFCFAPFLVGGCKVFQQNTKNKITTEKDFIQELYITKSKLEKKQKNEVARFMKVGYKQYPELKTMRALPIYAISGLKEWEKYKTTPVKDSLLFYLNPYELELCEVAFYNENDCIGIADPAYMNHNSQPIGYGDSNTRWVDSIIRKEEPDLIFYITDSSFPLFVLKDGELYCFDIRVKYQKEKYTVDEYIKECIDEDDLYWLIRPMKIIPPVYCK